jgi:putative transposase
MGKVPNRKTVRHFHQSGDFHELTFSCYRQMPLLVNDDWRRRLSRSIDNAATETKMELVAFVFMPEHVHLLVYPLLSQGNIDLFLARLKQPFSKQIKELLTASHNPLLSSLTVRERPGKYCFRFWQEGPGFDRNIFTPAALQASIHYIHCNPVRRKLCGRATEWEWSSARYYAEESLKQQWVELPHIHGIRSGTS